MLTAIVILGIWTVLAIPLSVIVGASLRDVAPPELEGMDGPVLVYRRADGSMLRVPFELKQTA